MHQADGAPGSSEGGRWGVESKPRVDGDATATSLLPCASGEDQRIFLARSDRHYRRARFLGVRGLRTGRLGGSRQNRTKAMPRVDWARDAADVRWKGMLARRCDGLPVAASRSAVGTEEDAGGGDDGSGGPCVLAPVPFFTRVPAIRNNKGGRAVRVFAFTIQ